LNCSTVYVILNSNELRGIVSREIDVILLFANCVNLGKYLIDFFFLTIASTFYTVVDWFIQLGYFVLIWDRMDKNG
jgi:hypothetical protein